MLGAQRLLDLESLQTDETPAVCHSPSSLQTLRKGEIKVTDCLKQENHLQGLQFSSLGEVEHFDSRVLQESKESNLEAHLWLLRASSGPKALQQFGIQPPDAAEVQFRFQSLFIPQLIASK